MIFFFNRSFDNFSVRFCFNTPPVEYWTDAISQTKIESIFWNSSRKIFCETFLLKLFIKLLHYMNYLKTLQYLWIFKHLWRNRMTIHNINSGKLPIKMKSKYGKVKKRNYWVCRISSVVMSEKILENHLHELLMSFQKAFLKNHAWTILKNSWEKKRTVGEIESLRKKKYIVQILEELSYWIGSWTLFFEESLYQFVQKSMKKMLNDFLKNFGNKSEGIPEGRKSLQQDIIFFFNFKR